MFPTAKKTHVQKKKHGEVTPGSPDSSVLPGCWYQLKQVHQMDQSEEKEHQKIQITQNSKKKLCFKKNNAPLQKPSGIHHHKRRIHLVKSANLQSFKLDFLPQISNLFSQSHRGPFGPLKTAQLLTLLKIKLIQKHPIVVGTVYTNYHHKKKTRSGQKSGNFFINHTNSIHHQFWQLHPLITVNFSQIFSPINQNITDSKKSGKQYDVPINQESLIFHQIHLI